MDIVLKMGKMLWKLFWITLDAVLEIASEPKKSVIGHAEAHRRREEGTISPDEFYEATKNHLF